MFETLQHARDLLGGLAESRAVGALSGEDCVAVIHELGTIRRLVEALTADAAAKIEATDAHRPRGERSAAETCANLLQVGPGPASDLLAAARAAADDDRIEREIGRAHV